MVRTDSVIGECTLAVTTLKSVRRGGLPAAITPPSGGFPVSGVTSWSSIYTYADNVLKRCVKQKKTGVFWGRKFISAVEVLNFKGSYSSTHAMAWGAMLIISWSL